MPKKCKKDSVKASTVMIRVFPEDAKWINEEAIRRTKVERKRNTQYSIVHEFIESARVNSANSFSA